MAAGWHRCFVITELLQNTQTGGAGESELAEVKREKTRGFEVDGRGHVKHVESAAADEGGVPGGQLAGDWQKRIQRLCHGHGHARGEILGKTGFRDGDIGARRLFAEEAKLEGVFQFELLPGSQNERPGRGGDGSQRLRGVGVAEIEGHQQTGVGVSGRGHWSPRPAAINSAWVTAERTIGGKGRLRQ